MDSEYLTLHCCKKASRVIITCLSLNSFCHDGTALRYIPVLWVLFCTATDLDLYMQVLIYIDTSAAAQCIRSARGSSERKKPAKVPAPAIRQASVLWAIELAVCRGADILEAGLRQLIPPKDLKCGFSAGRAKGPASACQAGACHAGVAAYAVWVEIAWVRSKRLSNAPLS